MVENIRNLDLRRAELEKELDEQPNKVLGIIENKTREIIHINLYVRFCI